MLQFFEKFKSCKKEKIKQQSTVQSKCSKFNKLNFTIVSVVCILLLITIIMSILPRGMKLNDNLGEYNPEIARSMSYDPVKAGEEDVNGIGSVKFDAFFLRDLNNDGIAEGVRGSCRKIGEDDTLYMELKVNTDGRLENAFITINENNIYFQTKIIKDKEIADNYIGNNTQRIDFNTISAGTQKFLTGTVRSGDYTVPSRKSIAIGNDISNYSNINSVVLEADYIDKDGNKTHFTKEVKFQMDWHGELQANINIRETNRASKDLKNLIDTKDNQLKLNFVVITEETKNELILKQANFKSEIPLLNGYEPINAVARGDERYVAMGNDNVVSQYDSATRTLTATKKASLDGNSISQTVYDRIENKAQVTVWNICITYPIEAYATLSKDTISYKLPVEVVYEGYNNQNSEFKNPQISNTAKDIAVINYRKPGGDVALFTVEVGNKSAYSDGRFVLKEKPLRILNGQSNDEIEDIYEVNWIASTGPSGTGEMMMTETKNGEAQVSDKFIKLDTSEDSMSGLVSNIGIYFVNATELLGKDGWIRITGGSRSYLFTSENWDNYDAENPFYYDEPIEHVKIETSCVTNNSYMEAHNLKEINDEELLNRYSRDELENLKHIKSTLTGYIYSDEITSGSGTEDGFINTDFTTAEYKKLVSKMSINLRKNVISTQAKESNLITIEGEVYKNSDVAKWVDGTFLVKIPSEVLELDIKSVESNNPDVEIIGYYQYEEYDNENKCNNIYVKVYTTGTAEDYFSIILDTDMIADSRIITQTSKVELYASNEYVGEYLNPVEDFNDINENMNTSENIGKADIDLSFIAPATLLTGQMASEFDNEGSVVVAPQLVNIDDSVGKAKITVFLHNNYENTVSEAKILGRIPTQGNQHILQEQDLKSAYDSTLLGPITIPDDLVGKVTVYYSKVVNPTKDLLDINNQWKEQSKISSDEWKEIKSYMIDFNDQLINANEHREFSYEISVPNDLQYNQLSYSAHAIYFNLDTTEGKYKTSVEPSKLGLGKIEKYNLEITKYKTGTNTLVKGATYMAVVASEENEGAVGIIGVTNGEGKVVLKGLHLNEKYVIKEIKSPDGYELNEDRIIIGTTADANTGDVSIYKEQGTTRGDVLIQRGADGKCHAWMAVEDETKVNLILNKIDVSNSTALENVVFELSGYGIDKKELKTDKNGIINIDDLSLNQEYILKEISADGYYLVTSRFKIERNGTSYSINNLEGNLNLTGYVLENEIPRVNATLANKKIPTYTLQIKKVRANDEKETVLSGARYEITSEDTGNVQYGSTDSSGMLTISGLYSYVNGKYITGNYTIREITPPEGYASSSDVIKLKATLEGETLSTNIENKDNLKSVKSIDVSGNTVILVLQDNPAFSIKKVDSNTKLGLPGAKFIIYKTDSNGNILDYARDPNGNYVGKPEITYGVDSDGNVVVTDAKMIVTTDENGEIAIPLQGGFYKAVEIEAPEGYNILKENGVVPAQQFVVEGYEAIKINYIEDLVDFAEAVKSGNSFGGQIVSLARTLDFNDNGSYRNPYDTKYGDYNQDGTTQGIKDELTNTAGRGFSPIGYLGDSSTSAMNFAGTFLGNGFEIRNIYMNGTNYGSSQISLGFFMGISEDAKIENLGVTGEIKYDKTSNTNVLAIGTLVVYNRGSLVNCHSNVNITAVTSGNTTIGGIAWYNYNSVKKCYNAGNINITNNGDVVTYVGGIIFEDVGNVETILGCYNTGNITINAKNGATVGGIISRYQGIDIEKCYNTGTISVRSSNKDSSIEAGGIVGFVQNSSSIDNTINNCYNAGKITSITENTEDGTNNPSSGGIVGVATGNGSGKKIKITNCRNDREIESTGNSAYAGGIIGGYNSAVEIQSCYNTASIKSIANNSYAYAGGIAGQAVSAYSISYPTYIINCYNTGSVYAKSQKALDLSASQVIVYCAAGGIAGLEMNSTIVSTYNAGDVLTNGIALTGTGGIIGSMSPYGKIYNCYNKGNVTNSISTSDATNHCGTAGISGFAGGIIDNCYNVGSVSSVNNRYTGSIIGRNTGINSISRTYYLTGTGLKGSGNSSGITETAENMVPKTSSEMANLVSTLNGNMSNLPAGFQSTTWKSGNPYPELNMNIMVDTTAPVVEETKIVTETNIEVVNAIKEYRITTEIGENSSGARVGGTITGTDIAGENNKFVESVQHGKNAQNNIVIVPNAGYSIKSITLDGTPVEYVINERGEVVLPKLENVVVDHHYVVIFESNIGRILVHHYLDGTQNSAAPVSVAPDQMDSGEIGSSYTTSPEILEKYELKKDESGKYVIPSNAYGEYTQGTQVITYLYVIKQVPLIVNHYIEGTENPVPLRDGSDAQSIHSSGEEGTEYTTSSLTEEELSDGYELVKEPSNKTGIYEYPSVEVNYYYRLKRYNITTKVTPITVTRYNENTNTYEDVIVDGGTISGQDEDPYETVARGQDSKKDIVIKPDEGYRIKSITINGKDIGETETGYTTEPDGSVILDKFVNVTENKEVVVEFEPIIGNLIVNHYIEGSTDSVPLNDGTESKCDERENPVGYPYATKQLENLLPNWELVRVEGDTSGKYIDGTITVTYYYEEIKEPHVVISKASTVVANSKLPDRKLNGYVSAEHIEITDVLAGYEVIADEKITYMIKLDNSLGTAGTKVKVKDSAPVGTMFQSGSMTLNSVNVNGTIIEGTSTDLSEKTEADLRDTGINVEVEAGEIKVLSFAVTVVDTNDRTATDLSNNTAITNIAQVSKNPEDKNPIYEDTNEVTHVYVEPKLSLEKTLETSNKEKTGGKYVEESETITYTITVTNEGGLAKDVKVIDELPDGVTFVDNTLKIDGKSNYTFNGEVVDLTTKVASDLLNGIDVSVPAKVGANNEKVVLTFDVTVDMLNAGEYYKELNNIAKVEDLTDNANISVNKSNIKFGKTVEKDGKDIDKENVRLEDELTYNIWVSNIGGTKSDIVKIFDNIPDKTEYVANSVKLGSKTYTDEQLEVGIDGITLIKEGDEVKSISAENIEVEPDKTVTLSFKVKVSTEAENGYVIKNRAYVNENPTTPDTENSVVRPIIDVHKEIVEVTHITGDKDAEAPSDTLKDRKDYVFRGDKITYNIKATNIGDLDGRILIKDVISDKVELDVNSIKVGDTVISGMTAEKFTSEGIEVTVPAKTADKAGEVILSFTVTVKGNASDEVGVVGDVENQAKWNYKNPIEDPDPEKEHNTEKPTVPIVVIKKEATINRTTEKNQTIAEGKVTANDEIIYTIIVENTGTEDAGEFIVKDDIPKGTTIKEDVKYHNNDLSDGELEDKTISWMISSLPAKQEGTADNTVEISFTVTVDYDEVASNNIVNMAYVNDKPTNEVETPYDKPTPKMKTEIVKTGDEITMAGNKVYYKITYTGYINNFVGKTNVTIADELPYRIDENKSELNGGIYKEDLENKKYTITWELPTEEINTYSNNTEHTIIGEKEIWLYYTEELESNFTNTAIAITQLKEPNPDNLEEDINVGEPDKATDTHVVTVKTAYKLPDTGRNGTTIFALVGLMIVGMTVVMCYKFKHKEL